MGWLVQVGWSYDREGELEGMHCWVGIGSVRCRVLDVGWAVDEMGARHWVVVWALGMGFEDLGYGDGQYARLAVLGEM